MSKLVNMLYQLAWAANDISKVASGDPKKIAYRVKNKYIGKKLNKHLADSCGSKNIVQSVFI